MGGLGREALVHESYKKNDKDVYDRFLILLTATPHFVELQ